MSLTSTRSLPTSRRRHLASGKRTNSLGWAKSDCHTCARLSRSCDRRRPRCSACLSSGVTCSGYVQQLNWDRGTLRRGLAATSTTGASDTVGVADPDEDGRSRLPRPSAFIFVDQSDPTNKAKKKPRKNSKSTASTVTVDGIGVAGGEPTSPTSSTSPSSSTTLSVTRSHMPLTFQDALPARVVFRFSPSLNRTGGAVEDALAYYHSFFSYITLTYAVPVNPWQAALPQIHDPVPCVRYAAVALAQRHRAHLQNKPEPLSVLNLQTNALSMFASHLSELSFESGVSACLLLIALDYAETGFSNWTIHLRGAHRILESNGGIGAAEWRPNLRSQIAMLIWYDVTAALISRCGPVFPRHYLETLVMWQTRHEWTLLALNGCPDSIWLDIYDLAVAAIAPEMLLPATVADMEARISHAAIHGQGSRQLVLMSRAWKLALLLYCARVFPQRPTSTARRLDPLDCEADRGEAADATLDVSHDHPRDLALDILGIMAELPAQSNAQKQCFLPAVLAACEMSSSQGSYRNMVTDYCERWKRRTGIWTFDSGLDFMRGVWSRNDQERQQGGQHHAPAHHKQHDDVDDDDDHGDPDVADAMNDDSDIFANEDSPRGGGAAPIMVPWTKVYPPGVGCGFLFG